ncbi:MAG TPA: hypothetical protein VFB58_02590 [Chloroflexota bacterium]|nr:hypothetical protein [Chloroflexota bacterium]
MRPQEIEAWIVRLGEDVDARRIDRHGLLEVVSALTLIAQDVRQSTEGWAMEERALVATALIEAEECAQWLQWYGWVAPETEIRERAQRAQRAAERACRLARTAEVSAA